MKCLHCAYEHGNVHSDANDAHYRFIHGNQGGFFKALASLENSDKLFMD